LIRFNHNEDKSIPKSFGIDEHEAVKIDALLMRLIRDKEDSVAISWAVQRIWLDETISDNAKCYLIFSIGRFYQAMLRGE
jgi:hypothetical protein